MKNCNKTKSFYKNSFILIVIFATIFFTGCVGGTTASKTNIKKVRFQSVPITKAIVLQTSKEKTSCAICSMSLPTFYKTNHVADTKMGIKQYCSIHCVMHDNELNKTDLKNLRVVDTNSLEFIPALKAYYVVGSSKPATMSRVSKYAFSKKSEAIIFAKKFGGKVVKFYEAYDEATKDFTKKH